MENTMLKAKIHSCIRTLHELFLVFYILGQTSGNVTIPNELNLRYEIKIVMLVKLLQNRKKSKEITQCV